MAIIIETGSGDNPAANSYSSDQQLLDYAADRGITLTGTPAVLLLQAMDYAESLSFKGVKTSETQPLQWPRSGVRIDGYAVPDNFIPGSLITAQIITAIAIDEGRDPLAPIEPSVKRERVSELEVEYQDGASSAAIDLRVSRAWSKLVGAGAGGGMNQIPVVRV